MSNTFKRGVYPPHSKKRTENLGISPANSPERVFISLSQHLGAPAECTVEPGQKVKAGELIGKASAGISANVFSSVSGEVSSVLKKNNSQGAKVWHVEIKNDFLNESVLLPALLDPTAEQIKERVKDAGIVGMGGASFPTHVKLSPPPDCTIDTLIINAAECEPYITCDHRIMLDLTDDFLKGVLLLKKALGASKAVIAVEDNKQSAIDTLAAREDTAYIKNFKYALDDKINIISLKSKYPQGAEKQLIYASTKRVVPEGALPSSVGVCVNNVHTALAVYRAVCEGKPLYERIVTVSGGACGEPCNMWVKSGTLYSDLAEICAVADSVEMVVNGGPMMGFSVSSPDISVTCATSAVLFLTAEEIDFDKPTACIACGKCVKSCPMKLMPVFIDSNVLSGDYKNAKKYGAMSCIECGCCSYVCPANKPLVQSIKLAKKVIRERKL